MTPFTFAQLLQQHTWSHESSPANDRLLTLCRQTPEFYRLYNHAEHCVINQRPIEFPAEMLEEPKPTTPANTPMKEVLALILATLIQPLIDAIDRLTAATKAGNTVGDKLLTTASEIIQTTTETPAPAVEKPTGAKRGPKPKTVETPAPEPEQTEEAADEGGEDYTMDELKALVITIPVENREKFKAGIKKNLNLESYKDAKTREERVALRVGMIKCGATPPAPAPAADEW